MNTLWLRIKIWSKMTLVAAVFVYVILFTYNNAKEQVKFWYWFSRQPQTNLLLLVLCAFIAGVIATFLVRTTYRTIRQVQETQHRNRISRLDREMTDMRTKAAMLRAKPDVAVDPTQTTSDEEAV